MLADKGISFKGTTHFSQASGESKFFNLKRIRLQISRQKINKCYLVQNIQSINFDFSPIILKLKFNLQFSC